MTAGPSLLRSSGEYEAAFSQGSKYYDVDPLVPKPLFVEYNFVYSDGRSYMKSMTANTMSFIPQKGDVIELPASNNKRGESIKFKVVKRVIPLVENTNGLNINLNTISIICKEIKQKKKKTTIDKLIDKLNIIR